MKNLYGTNIKLKDGTELDIRNFYLDEVINDNKVFVSNDPRIDNVGEYYLTLEQADIVNAGGSVLVDKKQAVKLK